MDELDTLRLLIGSDADAWTPTQFGQLQADIEAMAALLLDLYRSGLIFREKACGSLNVDVPQPDR